MCALGQQRNEVTKVLRRYEEIFTKIPGKASMIDNKIDLTDDRPIRCKLYPLPYAKRGEIQDEIKNKMDTRIVRESARPMLLCWLLSRRKMALTACASTIGSST